MGRTSGFVTSERAPKSALTFPGSGPDGPHRRGESPAAVGEASASAPAETARVFLMQNHPLMILGTASFLNRNSGFTVSHSATTPTNALDLLRAEETDVVIYELSITGPFHFAFLAELRSEYPQLPILAFSCHEEVILARRALEIGANGYLMKEAPPEELANALRHLLEGRTYLSSRVRARIAREDSAGSEGTSPFLNGSLINSLSLQELHVVHLIGEGLSLERIQREMQLSHESLSAACLQVRKKLGLDAWTDLIDFASHWVYYEGDFA